jgi:hypothetical protein
MSFDDDEFDLDAYLDSLTPDDCRRLGEVMEMADDLDDAQKALERVYHDDPVGAVFFSEDDSWLEPRLSGEIDTRPK